jgi:hypothetical protein
MNKGKCFTNSGGLVLCSLLLGAVTGCVGYVEESHHVRGYAPAPAVYAQSAVIVQEDYTYYPGYEVYYSGRSRQYVYQEGRAWVSRPAPPRVAVDVLVASPSVRVDFHDAPATHHAAVVQTYPKNWTPPGWDHGNKGGHKKNKDKDN